jgi:hypothetical protein
MQLISLRLCEPSNRSSVQGEVENVSASELLQLSELLQKVNGHPIDEKAHVATRDMIERSVLQ